MLLYEQIAHDVAASIQRGALKRGDRLPSVRKLAGERGVSIATVLSAYQLLESDGYVETLPKSGHFVRQRETPSLPQPRVARKVMMGSHVSVWAGVSTLISGMKDPSVVPLGAACIASELLPVASLNRMLATAAREMRTAGASYDLPPGLPTLRRQLAKRGLSWGLSIREDEIVTTNGATEALHLCLRAVAKAGELIAVESPTYFGVLQLIEELGYRVIEIPTHPRTGLDVDALEQVLAGTRVSAVLAIPTVSNPLGAVMPDDEKKRLVDLLVRHDVPLIEDDVYGDLMFDGTRPRPVKAFDRDGRVLLCGSVCKTLAPGYRVGWVSPGRYQDVVERMKFSQSVASPTLTQMAVAEFLASGHYDRHLRTLRRVLGQQVERVRASIAESFPAETRVSAPQGGFVVWVEMPQQVDAFQLQRRAFEHGIAVAPGPIFSARGRFANCLRLSCGSPWSDRIERAIRTLGKLASEAL